MPWTFWIDSFFLWYFSAINAIYTFLLALGMVQVYFRRKELSLEDFANILRSNSLPEICFIIPMYNEAKNIVKTIQGIQHLTYRYKQLIAVNDGSDDETMEVLKRELTLVPVPLFYQETVATEQVRCVYRSKTYPEIMVIDKGHRGKHDAINAGLNACTQPFFICADADTFIDNEAFQTLIHPILATPETIAIGASIRVRNGCTFNYNRISTTDFPKKFLPAIQGLEYLRSFLMRQGLDWIRGNFVIAGAFSIFSTDVIRKVGGFGPTVAEDIEIIVRLHRVLREAKIPYRIHYLPDPVSWTEVPSTMKALGKQRTKWHFGLLESIWYHKKMFCNPTYGPVGWFTYPFMVLGEAIEPLVEIMGYVYIMGMWYFGLLNIPFFVAFIILSFGFTFLYSVGCLLIEEISFKKYPSLKTLLILFSCCFIENLGYRQLNAFWKMRGFIRFFREFAKIRKDTKTVNRLVRGYENGI